MNKICRLDASPRERLTQPLGNDLKVFISLTLIGFLLVLCGCNKHISIAQPAPPSISPSDYSADTYNADNVAYRNAVTPGANFNLDVAKQKRNEIAYGLMGQIDVVYGAYYNQLFSTKNGMAVGGDALTLGLSTAATIASNGATKTILSALGTGFSGLALSVDKNYFAQQTFPVIGVAMQTRRDKVRNAIVGNLSSDVTTYPLLAAKRDLIAYFNAGTLASGLQELQEEAGSGTVPSADKVTAGKKPDAPAGLTAASGSSQVALAWTASSGATSYNLYFSNAAGVTPANGTKVSSINANSYTQTGLANGTYFYVVTAVNASGESTASSQVSAAVTAPAAAVAGAVPQPPSTLTARAGDGQVGIVWNVSAGATSYNLYYSTNPSVTVANGVRIAGITTNSYHQSGLVNGTTYHYVVTAVNATGESAPSAEGSATPAPVGRLEPLIRMTPH